MQKVHVTPTCSRPYRRLEAGKINADYKSAAQPTTSRRYRAVALLYAATLFNLSGDVFFERDIRPIFRAHCYDCHGAHEEKKGDLDLRLVRFMQTGGESGPAIVAGKPAESFLLQRLRKGEMPPGEAKVSEAEIQTIEQWIAAGAKTVRPEPETIGPGLGITPEERSHWAFQPVQPPPIEAFPSQARVRTPIDALILKAMPEGMSFSPDADRATLIRRAYLNLTGLPPAPDELETWRTDRDPQWYDRLLDDLLNSPHYGERWARHWLDVAGYADSEGGSTQDKVRPWAWRYRDWVIRAFNADKPFDQFLIEQLAGDELAGPRKSELTADQVELLAATGFLRMAADGTSGGANNAEGRNQVMADTMKIIGTSLLGLSLQCAQCHDHRYDPIPQTDYYALRAIFEPALDWQQWRTPEQRRLSLYTDADRAKAAEIETEANKINQEKSARQGEYMAQALEQELNKFEEPLRAKLRIAYQTAGGNRSPEQKSLLAQNPSINITPGNLYQYIPKSKEELKKFDDRMAAVRAKKPAEEFLRALAEPDQHVPVTRLFHRGDHAQPKQAVLPAALTVTAPDNERMFFTTNNPALPTTGRRLAFAQWLTRGDHPLVARVIVNRVWMHHFGHGLVKTPADFGKLGTAPSHPELLDWLADQFVRDGWSLKRLHRRILSSTVWRQSSRVAPDDASRKWAMSDPQARFYWRKPLVRLEAEAIRDRMLAATDSLDRSLYGKPLSIKEDDSGQVIVEQRQTRRSLYIQMRRSQPVALLQTFDAPVMETNCENRPNSTSASQSLMLINGDFILDQAVKLAARTTTQTAVPESLSIAESKAAEPARPLAPRIVQAWRIALCREPNPAEFDLALRFVSQQLEHYTANPDTVPTDRSAPEQAMVNLCQSLMGSNEFLYVD